MDRFSSPVRAPTAVHHHHRPSITRNEEDGDIHHHSTATSGIHQNSSSSSSSYCIQPSPYALCLAALISLHNHAEGTALQYTSNEDAEKINTFLQDVLFFPKQQKSHGNDQHLQQLLCDLHEHMQQQHPPSTTATHLSIPQQLLQWLSVACESLDAFFDFCRTVADPSAATTATPATHASAAALWQRSVGQAIQQQQQYAEGNGDTAIVVATTGNFVRMTKLYAAFRQQVREAKVALEAHTSATATSSSPPLPEDETSAIGTRTSPMVHQHLYDHSSSSSSQQAWHHFIGQLQAKERVGATEALHAYMDHHGECLGTAGFLQVGVAAHFGASTTVARREAERVVQQHPGTPQSEKGGPAAAVVVVDATGAAAAATEETLAPPDPDCVTTPTTPAEHRAAGVNRALATLYGQAAATGSGARRFPQALRVLEDMPATTNDDLAYYLLQHEWAVRRCLWSDADDWMAALESRSAQHDDSPSDQEIVSQKAFYLAYRGDWQAAVELLKKKQAAVANEAATTTVRQEDHTLLQLQLAEIYVYAGQYAAALPPVLQYLADHPHDAPGLIVLATFQLEFLQDTVRANQLVRAALPLALQKAHVAWQAQAYWVLARCSSTDQLQQAAALERAIELFRSLDDTCRLRDIMYYAARFYQEHDESDKRDRAAKEWLQLREPQQAA